MRDVLPRTKRPSGIAAALVLLCACSAAGPSPAEQLGSPDEPVRYAAAVALGAEGAPGSPEQSRALRARLDDSSARVRIAVVRALARVQGRAAIPDLARSCADESADVRLAAAGELAALGGDEAVEPLLDLLDDREPQIREAARQALVQLGVPGAEQVSRAAGRRRQALVRQAESGSWSRRLEAARGLADCADEEALRTLEVLTRDQEVEVAREAARGVGLAPGAAGWPRVERVMSSVQPTVRDALLEGIVEAAPSRPGGAPPRGLCELLDDAGSARLAARAAARHGISCGLDGIAGALGSEDRDVRIAAAVVIATLAPASDPPDPIAARAAEVLWSDAAGDDLATVVALGPPPAAAATRVDAEIGRYLDLSRRWVPPPPPEPADGGEPDAAANGDASGGRDAGRGDVSALQDLIDRFPPRDSGWVEIFRADVDPDGLAATLLVAGEAGVVIEGARLEGLAQSAPDPQVRAAAVWALGGGLDYLSSESPQIRAVAAEAMRRRASSLDGPTKARLAFILGEPDPSARAAAAGTLAATRDPAALAPLLAAFERWREPAVAAALGELGQREAAEPIAAALVDPSTRLGAELAEALLGALERLGASDQGDAVAPFIGHPDARVRRAAVAAARSLGTSRLTALADERRGDLSLIVRDAASLTRR
jgi:HEAT repeat protein